MSSETNGTETNGTEPKSSANIFKQLFSTSSLTPKTIPVRVPNEQQYNEAAAFSLIAYKNQDPTQRSDLDTAKLNFENNYRKFLMLFGQYSNTSLPKYPLTNPIETIKYPIQNTTNVFDNYPMKRPFRD